MKREPFPTLLARWLAEREAKRASRTRQGMVGYAFLCALLRDEPITARQLEAKAQMGHVAAYRLLMTMHAMRRVHISSWLVRPRIAPVAVFSLGQGTDAVPPTVRPDGRPVHGFRMPQRRLCPGVMAFVQLLRAIEAPATRTEVEEATGLHHATVNEALEVLVALDLAHVALWLDRPQGGAPVENIVLGPGENAPKPKRNRALRRRLHTQREQSVRSFKAMRVMTDMLVQVAAS